VPLLEASDIAIRFGGVKALDGVGFEVNEWEIVGVLGPNGAGKTTLFDCVSGFTRPDRGHIRHRGVDITDLRPDERAARGIGRTFQQVGLVRSFSVLQNVVAAQHLTAGYEDLSGLLGSLRSRECERELRERAMKVLDFMGIADIADASLSDLAYGTLKMVEVAAALAVDPEILMLDEPLAGLAPEEASAFGDRLLAMRSDLALTIVIVDHHVPQVLRVADHVYVLNFGRLLAAGSPDEVRADRDVAEAYMGKGAMSGV